MPGMLSPCWEEVGDMSAPVGQNRRFFSSPRSNMGSRWAHNTLAEQPQPDPPAWTSCV